MLIETTEHIHRVKGAPLYYIGLTHQPKVATFYDYHSPSSPPYTNYDFLISMSKFVPQSSSLTLTPPISPLLVTEQTQEQSVKRGSVIMKVENCQVTVKDASVDQHICRWENCYRFFVSLEKLANHVSIAHSTVGFNNLYYCKWEGCQRSERGFNARYKMLVHCRTHTKEKPHFCTFKNCTKAFSRAENLKIHYRSHTLEKPYCCAFPGCIKAYSNSSDRFKHSRTHQNNKPYMCKVEGCSKRYTDPSSLRKHVKTFNHDLSNHIDKGSQDEPMECELSPPHDIINAIDPTENIYFDSLSYKKQSESVGLCWLTSSDLSDKPLDLRISHNSADK